MLFMKYYTLCLDFNITIPRHFGCNKDRREPIIVAETLYQLRYPIFIHILATFKTNKFVEVCFSKCVDFLYSSRSLK
jgi:hypothetical protein